MVYWTELEHVLRAYTHTAVLAKYSIRDATVVDAFPLEQLKQGTSVATTVEAPTVAPATLVAAPKQRPPHVQKHTIDPIVLGIEHIEPLYIGASAQMKHTMECEEAQRLEGLLSDVYKSQGGRARGWTKTGLEFFLKPRCATGGDLHKLKQAKQSFLWTVVSEDKPTSAFLDFLCVAKKLRLAIWDTDRKIIMVYPAADWSSEADTNYPLYHVTIHGNPMHGMQQYEQLLQFCESEQYACMPPLSVMNSLSHLTVAELTSVAEKLEMTGALEGTKAERVAAIASYKLRSRLLPIA